MGRGLSGIINMLREKEREAGRGIKRGVAGKVSGGAASGFKGMASGVIGSAKDSAGRRGSSYGRGGVRKIGEKYYFRANPYSGEGIKKWEPPKFAESGLMKLSQEGRENLLRANREEYLSRINPYSTPSEYIKSAEAKEKADKLKEKMRLKREEKEGSIKPLYGRVGNRQGVNNRVNGSGVSENLSRYGGRIRSKDYVKKPEPLPFITKRSEEERNRIHNSTQSIINNAKPVNSRSTYGEMNSRIPQYGKGRVSVGDLRNVGQYANVNARGGIELKPQIRRSAEEREKIHNSTQAVINSAKPVNSRSTYGEMNNRIPQYGKGRVSENDLRNVGQYANVDARGGIKIKPQIRRSAEEREKIHNSTQSIINNAKPVNSRSTYGEMNSRIPHYGKGRVSVGDLRNVGQYANVNARGGIELKPQIRRSAEERGNIQKTTNDIMDKYYTPYGKFNKENTYGNMEKARKEYVSFETKEKNLSNQEQEINKDKNKDYYIEKADKVSSDNNMAGLYFDKNPLKSFEEDSKYNKTKNEEDKKNYDYMTKEEKENAKYLLGKYGAEAQAEYLRDLVPRLNQRAGIAYMERELEDASPGRLKWESFKAGVGEKVKNTFQAGSVMGGNDEVFTPSAFEIAMDYLEENSDPETQKLIEDWKDRGDMTVSFAADLISPYLGIGLDSASEYGKSYTENLNNNANNPNMEKVKQSALKDAIVNTSINTALGMPNDMLKKAIGKDVKKVLNKHIKNDKGIKVISGLYNYLYDDRMNKEKKSWEKDNKKDDSFY